MLHSVSRTRPYTSIALTMGMIILVVLGAGCAGGKRGARPAQRPAKVATPSAEGASGVKISGKDYRFVYRAEGERAWALDAKSWRGDSTAKRLDMTGIDCRLYTKNRETLHAVAESGHVVQEGETLRVALSGKVSVVEAQRGLRLEADRFLWTSTDGAITAGNVHWRGLGFDHRADKGTFTTDLTRGKFSGHIRMTYSAKE